MNQEGTNSRSPRGRFVVSYDITDDKRRTKVTKTIAGYGHRVQYSVFECLLTKDDLAQLQERIQAAIDADKDDVRFYPLCESCVRRSTMLGKASLYEQESVIVV